MPTYLITEQQFQLIRELFLINETINRLEEIEAINVHWAKNPDAVKKFLQNKGYLDAWEKYNGDLLKIRDKFSRIFIGKDLTDFLKLFTISNPESKEKTFHLYQYDLLINQLNKLNLQSLVTKYINLVILYPIYTNRSKFTLQMKQRMDHILARARKTPENELKQELVVQMANLLTNKYQPYMSQIYHKNVLLTKEKILAKDTRVDFLKDPKDMPIAKLVPANKNLMRIDKRRGFFRSSSS